MQMKLRDVPNMLLRAYQAKNNVWLWGKPGIGKTDTVELFVQKMQTRIEGFQKRYFYGPTMSPTDIQAAMPDVDSRTMLVYNNAALPNWYTEPDGEGVVFFGEVGNTDPSTLKLLQKYSNGEDMNGVLRKPPGYMVLCDGNRLQDKSGVQQQGRAFMNRYQHIDVYTDAKDNTEYADKHGWHPTVQQFFREHPDQIDNYEDVFEAGNQRRSKEEITIMAEEGKRGIWACMRGWNRIHRLEEACEALTTQLMPQEIIGSVGTGVGQQYLAVRAFMGKLASVDDICANPKTAVVPTKVDELYAQCVILALKCDQKQVTGVHTYSKRLPNDMTAMIIRRMVQRQQQNNDNDNFKIVGTKEYIAWMSDKQLSDLYMAK